MSASPLPITGTLRPFIVSGDDLRAWRDYFALTRRQLADELSFSRATIRHWEARGQNAIPRARFAQVLDYFTRLLLLEEQQRAQAQRINAARLLASPAC